MQVQSMHFKQRAGQKLADVRLQKNLKKLADKFVSARSAAIEELARVGILVTESAPGVPIVGEVSPDQVRDYLVASALALATR